MRRTFEVNYGKGSVRKLKLFSKKLSKPCSSGTVTDEVEVIFEHTQQNQCVMKS